MYAAPSRAERETTNPNYEVVDKVEGQWVYLQGHPFPMYLPPTPEVIMRINIIKKILTLQPLKAAEEALDGIMLKPEYLHPCARELQKLFTGRVGQLIAQVINFDSAYRLRLQDLLSETNKETLSQRPIREIYRLIRINKVRDYGDAHQKIKKAGNALILALCWPPFRYYFKQQIKTAAYDNLQLSESDE